jgi:RNA polymerase sigma factor (sigma-70 family)
MSQEPQPPTREDERSGGRLALQGDEAQLFARYQARLLRATSATVITSSDNVDDACAFAWSQLLACQPRRECVFAWLRQVARREAIRLDGAGRRTVELDFETHPELAGHMRSPAAAHRSAETAQGLLEVRERLAVLPQDQREIAFMRAAGWRYGDIAECLHITEARVNKLLARADTRIRDLDQRDLATRSTRAARLQQLEDDPPPYLLSAIGRPPRPDPKRTGEHLRLEWRRIALAVDDYRATHGIADPYRALGAGPPAVTAGTDRGGGLEQRIASFAEARHRGIDRGL